MAPGTELGTSAWHRVTQEDISAFATLTRDEDPFHTDAEWAAEHSLFGTTIAFGFQTMSMLTYFSHQVFDQLGVGADDNMQLLNYGFNRVRIPEPVPAGSDIRGRFTLADATTRDDGGVQITLYVTVEIRDRERPALAAEWLFVAVPDAD